MNTLKKIFCLTVLAVLFGADAQAQTTTANAKVTVTNFEVYEKNDQLIINWATDGTVATNYWQLQNSTDGKKFSTFALVMGPDPRQQGDRYQYKGKLKVQAGAKVYYRVCPVDNDGKEIISEIIQPAK